MPPPGERIGVLGGTFDPVHIGHLVAAVNVRHALALDRVLLVVANVPWQKVGLQPMAPAEDRYAVVEAAVEASSLPGVEASRLEIERGGPSYTVDTLQELAGQRPRAELFLVIGSDIVRELDTWQRPEEVARLATLVVVARPGVEVSLPPAPWKAEVVDIPALDVSSTEIRARVKDGRPLEVLVPPAAVREIRKRGLYAS